MPSKPIKPVVRQTTKSTTCSKAIELIKDARNLRQPSDQCLNRAGGARADSTELNNRPLWLMACLVRQLHRQWWVARVVKCQLHCKSGKMGRLGYLGHPKGIAPAGEVPGFPEWDYFLHGAGCYLKYKLDGTAIGVEFTRKGSWNRIDPWLYSRYLDSLRSPKWPECLLTGANLWENPWLTALKVLADLGCVALRGPGLLGTIEILPKGVEVVHAIKPTVSGKWEPPLPWRACPNYLDFTQTARAKVSRGESPDGAGDLVNPVNIF